MKIKSDFVTNSSSTSFTFAWKGDKIDLMKELIKHSKDFDLQYEDYEDKLLTVDVWDIVRSIDDVMKNNPEDAYYKPEIVSIDEKIKEVKRSIEYYKELANDDDTGRWWSDSLEEEEEKLKLFESIKEKGLLSTFTIGFGDNHGEICGGRIGYTMDYRGRHISINDSGLLVTTEQNR